MTKQNFIKNMKELKELFDVEEKINKGFEELNVEKDFPTYISLSKPINIVIDILKDEMNDEYDNISYFIYDLKWGKTKIAKNCITEKDGTKISLQTTSQLYDYLMTYSKDN